MKYARIIIEQRGEGIFLMTACDKRVKCLPFMQRVGTMDEIREALKECSYYVENAD